MAQSIAPEQGSPPPNDQLSAVKIAFPKTRQDFDQDPRVSFSKLENKWILEDDDGQEYEWNEAVQKWTPVLDDSLREQQQQAYASKTEAEQDDAHDEPQAAGKKRKGSGNQQDHPSKKTKKPNVERPNSAVYAMSIPLDATLEEIETVFGKYGMIAEGTDNNRKRITMHKDKESGNFIGEATIIYFRPESVALAVQMLDDSDFRFGVQGPGGPMQVSEASRQFKKQKDDAVKKDDGESFFRARRPNQTRVQIKAKTQKMNEKLADWSDDEEIAALPQTDARLDKVVILRHMFTLDELSSDPKAAQEIREDIKEEAETVGLVEEVTLFDKEPAGVVAIRFMDHRAAEACVKKMHGRRFDGRIVVATIALNTERFQRTDKGSGGEDDEGDRLGQFTEWLESQE